ncbi:hypothetical protein PO124_18405 [Bacillus licheniformis]|nr:hypothetical protein [Bacillus licheniformis]
MQIKGSVNHIYHTPGSTYYDRTKTSLAGSAQNRRRVMRVQTAKR